MTNHYRKRRIKAGLTISDVAVGIDMDYMQYALIDRGLKKMPNKYLDRFNTLLGRSKGEAVVAKMSREELVEEWWSEIIKKEGHGCYGLTKIMNTFNIETLGELDKLLGYSSTGATSRFLSHPEKVTYNIKNKYFSFFEDEINIQPIKKKPNVKKEVAEKPNAVLFNWYNNFDFDKWFRENNISQKTFCKETNISTGTLHNLRKKKFAKPTLETIMKIKTYYDNFKPTTGDNIVMTFTSVPSEEVPEDIRRIGQELVREVNENMVLKEKLLSKYEGIIEGIENDINKYRYIIERLEDKKAFYEQIINDINED